MKKNIKPITRIGKFERRNNINVLGKTNSPVNRRPYPAGKPHPSSGIILKLKEQNSPYKVLQNSVHAIRIFYGNMREKQLKNIFKKIVEKKGKVSTQSSTGNIKVARSSIKEEIVKHLESMLCSLVFRAQWATHIIAAKQLVSHGKILVNGKKINISSYLVKVGDKISLHESMYNNTHVLESMKSNKYPTPEYLEIINDGKEVIVQSMPNVSSLTYTFDISFQSVVEAFSK